VQEIMSVIDLWEIDSAGEDTKRRIIRESRRINVFVTINVILVMTWATSHVVCYDCSETVFVRRTLHLLFPRLATFLVVLFNLTTYVAGVATMAHPFQMIYVTEHVTFQMYMCKILIEELSSCKTLEEKLIYDEDYQDLTKLRLKSLIKRHSDFIR
jgi:hypothetical protein